MSASRYAATRPLEVNASAPGTPSTHIQHAKHVRTSHVPRLLLQVAVNSRGCHRACVCLVASLFPCPPPTHTTTTTTPHPHHHTQVPFPGPHSYPNDHGACLQHYRSQHKTHQRTLQAPGKLIEGRAVVHIATSRQSSLYRSTSHATNGPAKQQHNGSQHPSARSETLGWGWLNAHMVLWAWVASGDRRQATGLCVS